ncbi:hypothetical protein [Sphingomonas aerophila]|uniref:Uncharacterized protein n=1 Tax=Sphingomonas aerophila TaxID=1344948 RepID=A0A7W9BH80_9SPHN|nr:hypothetical protein [Sphingomonas aerophila]MBB5716816.1 hypothetical protein [Sphingomonas aerophila]
MQQIYQSGYMALPSTRLNGVAAWQVGQLVHDHSQLPGAHRTPSAELGNDVLSHAKGKYGELAFFDWLLEIGLTPDHTPFRGDYTKKVAEDDFIVNGHRLEIKSKMRSDASPFPPKATYNVNIGKQEIENALHIFVEISGKRPLEEGPLAIILGWATPALIRARGQRTWPGKVSANGRFTFKRHDWDLAISDLLKPELLVDELRAPRADRTNACTGFK